MRLVALADLAVETLGRLLDPGIHDDQGLGGQIMTFQETLRRDAKRDGIPKHLSHNLRSVLAAQRTHQRTRQRQRDAPDGSVFPTEPHVQEDDRKSTGADQIKPTHSTR